MAEITTDAIRRERVLRDPYFAPMLPRRVGLLARAGWFDDGYERAEQPVLDTPLPLTPTAHLRTDRSGGELAVLVCTGAFSPVHAGHVSMMEAARAAVEAAGIPVVGGYLSPGHDAYVDGKYGGTAAAPATTRIAACWDMLAERPWLDVTQWEALGVDRAVNFTDVVRHVQRVVERVDTRLRVWYVFGSDNAGFAHAFARSGRAVCVARGGQERPGDWPTHPQLLYAAHDGPHRHESSSRRRALAPDWAHAVSQRGTYALRDDLTWALPEASTQQRHDLVEQISGAIEQAFEPNRVEMIVLDAEAQTQWWQTANTRGAHALLLDPVVACPDDRTLSVCRLFDVGTDQRAPHGLIERPGTPALSVQLEGLPAGSYTLVDDDIASGATMRALEALLGPERPVVERVSLLTATGPAEVLDVVDARDFVIDAREGGLCVEVDGVRVRVPYAWPYVDLGARMRLPAASWLAFSARVWQMNADRFATRDTRIAQLPAAATWIAFGWDPTILVYDLCVHHQLAIVIGGGRPVPVTD